MDLSVDVVRRNNLPAFVLHPPKKRSKHRKNRGKNKRGANGREDNEEGDEGGDEIEESENANAVNGHSRFQFADKSEMLNSFSVQTTAREAPAARERLDMSEGNEGDEDVNEDGGENEEVELIFGTADEDDEEGKDIDDEATSATSYASAEGSPIASGSPQSSRNAQLPDLGSPLKRSRH